MTNVLMGTTIIIRLKGYSLLNTLEEVWRGQAFGSLRWEAGHWAIGCATLLFPGEDTPTGTGDLRNCRRAPV